MLVIVLECAPPKVVGYCSSWALQVATGVYVANLPRAQRDRIWEYIQHAAEEETRAVMVWPASTNEQGLEYRTLGTPRRAIVEREGLLVSTFLPRPAQDLADAPPPPPKPHV